MALMSGGKPFASRLRTRGQALAFRLADCGDGRSRCQAGFSDRSVLHQRCLAARFAMFNAKPAVQALAAADIARWLDKGQLKANVAKTFPLTDLAKAHELQEANTLQKAGTLHGKIVITM